MAVANSADCLAELAVAALVDVPGACSDQDLICGLIANACKSRTQQWALAVLLASTQVSQVAETLTSVVGVQRAHRLLLEWAGTFESEMPSTDFFAEARTALKKDIVEALGDACEMKAMNLVQEGFIRLPSWSASDFKTLNMEENEELKNRLANWFLTGLTQKLAHCFDCCGFLTRMDCLEENGELTLTAAVAVSLHAGLTLRELVMDATSMAEKNQLLRKNLPTVKGIDQPSDPTGEEFISLLATALDTSFRRVEAEMTSLLLRPLWRLAAARRIWNQWTEQVPKVRRLREDEVLPDDAVAETAKEAEPPKQKALPKAKPEAKSSQAKKSCKKNDLQDWSRRSLAMLNEMGWSGSGKP